MSGPQRFPYTKGDRVFVEATVVAFEPGEPFGAVHVNIPEATDPSFLLDGVEAIVPQAIAHPDPGVDVPDGYTAQALSEYRATEGFYEEDVDE